MKNRLATLMFKAADTRAELDEKALLITFFVLIAMVGLSALGFSVSDQFNNLAGLI